MHKVTIVHLGQNKQKARDVDYLRINSDKNYQTTIRNANDMVDLVKQEIINR